MGFKKRPTRKSREQAAKLAELKARKRKQAMVTIADDLESIAADIRERLDIIGGDTDA